MRKIILFLFALFFLNSYSQTDLKQLKARLERLPANASIEVTKRDKQQVMKVDTVKKELFVPHLDFRQVKSIKYSDKIQEVSREEEIQYKNKLPLNFPIDKIKIIPEYHIEVPENGVPGEDSLIFVPFLISQKPLIYDTENEKLYKSVLSFILYSEAGEDTQKIKNPVHLEINSSRLNSEPQKFTIDHLNLPSKDITVFTKEALDSVDLKIVTGNAPGGYTFYLKVDPFLRLYSEDDDIQGFGIEEAKFEVQFRGSTSPEEELITIRSSAGEVEPSSFTLAYNESKIVKVRSQGLKDIVVSASVSTSGNAPIPDSNTLVFKQKFPYIFLGFALFGGILGVLIRVGIEGVKKFPARMMMSGILMGILGSLAYYVLGINLLELEVSATFNEFAVLTFSALCSLLLQPLFFKPRGVLVVEPDKKV